MPIVRIVAIDGPVWTPVLNTTELLEKIILELPLLVMYATASRVAKKWNAVIHEAPQVRRKLFRETDQEVVHPATLNLGKGDLIPYVANFALNTAMSKETYTMANGTERGPRIPFWKPTVISGIQRFEHEGKGHSIVNKVFFQREERLPWRYGVVSRLQYSPSWLEMFLSNPPFSVAHVLVVCRFVRPPFEKGFFRDEASIRDPNGIKFRQLEWVTDKMFWQLRQEYRTAPEHWRDDECRRLLQLRFAVAGQAEATGKDVLDGRRVLDVDDEYLF